MHVTLAGAIYRIFIDDHVLILQSFLQLTSELEDNALMVSESFVEKETALY